MASIANSMTAISILLVEDEKVTLDLLATILAKKYPQIILYTAINGRLGLELFKTHMPDIVITDLNMPELGGVHMTAKIRAIRPDTKFIVLTGDSGKFILQDSVEQGFEFDHLIVKPVVFQELFAAIEMCLAGVAPDHAPTTRQGSDDEKVL